MTTVTENRGGPAGREVAEAPFGTDVLAVRGCESLTAANAPRSALHDPAEPWSPTNCYMDVWIGLTTVLGLDPVPMLGAAFSADFLGDQWEFLKPRQEDIEALYGLTVGEYDTWRPLGEHLQRAMSRGDALVVEVDAFHLPDTAGVSYRAAHTKTSIVPLRLDPVAGELVYLHNDGVHVLSGEDLENTLGPGARAGAVPFPYVELVRTQDVHRLEPRELWQCATGLARAHVRRAPDTSPAQRLVAAIRAELPALAGRGMDYFHVYSFATTRQAGLTAGLAAHACRYLAEGAEQWPSDLDVLQLRAAAESLDAAAAAAKTLQFQLARAASGRTPRVDASAQAFVSGYDTGMRSVRDAVGMGE
ncbi:DUF1839 family protein [Kocuria rhizophila]|uniref:DUF1839 family protein n=1 Tax=Kocuria rhizophila TaxID=72000 RepID=UPI0021A3ED7F|nr:DUF1839 family protein [Kocuria rhizophila]MCT2249608.1 DUF1839 family protein [Kocuria rhizophila]